MAPTLRLAEGMRVTSRRGSAAIVVMLTTILSVAHGERPRAASRPDKLNGALRSLLERPPAGLSKVRVIALPLVDSVSLDAQMHAFADQDATTPGQVLRGNAPSVITVTALNTRATVAREDDVCAQGEAGSEGGSLAHGAGSVNADGAIELARRLDTTMTVGRWWLTSGLVPVSVFGSTSTSWGQHVVCGDQVPNSDMVFFSAPAFRDQATWRSHVVWGDSTVGRTEGEHVVWGDTTFGSGDLAWGNLYTSDAKAADTLGISSKP